MIAIELVGRLDDMNYFGFGPSGASDKTQMDGADPVIADYFNDEFRARDYYLISKGKITSQTVKEWISLYLSQTLYGAALFVSYEAFQISAAWLVNVLVSGCDNKCIDAVDYSGFVDRFIVDVIVFYF
jgi:hypothetical protein